MSSKRWAIKFKAHRNSERIYTLESAEPGAIHFVAAALRANGWVVLEAAPSEVTITVHPNPCSGYCTGCGRPHE